MHQGWRARVPRKGFWALDDYRILRRRGTGAKGRAGALAQRPKGPTPGGYQPRGWRNEEVEACKVDRAGRTRKEGKECKVRRGKERWKEGKRRLGLGETKGRRGPAGREGSAGKEWGAQNTGVLFLNLLGVCVSNKDKGDNDYSVKSMVLDCANTN